MSAIACLGSYAKIPYYFEKLDIRVFCMEELCHCLKENAFLLGTEIMQEGMLKFIANECDVPQLARELYPLVHKKGNVSTFVAMILEYVGFYDPEEIRSVEQTLKQGAHLSDYEKRKVQIDYMAEKKKYGLALEEYRQLLESMPKTAAAAAVLHNMGVVCAHMMRYHQAADYFKQAYELDGSPEQQASYLGAMRFALTDQEYVDFAAKLAESAPVKSAYLAGELELERLLEQTGKAWENSPECLGIANMREWRLEGRMKKYQEESEQILENLKKEYKNYV